MPEFIIASDLKFDVQSRPSSRLTCTLNIETGIRLAFTVHRYRPHVSRGLIKVKLKDNDDITRFGEKFKVAALRPRLRLRIPSLSPPKMSQYIDRKEAMKSYRPVAGVSTRSQKSRL